MTVAGRLFPVASGLASTHPVRSQGVPTAAVVDTASVSPDNADAPSQEAQP